MTPRRYTPTAAAKLLELGTSTVRNWSGEYAQFLSPAANPGPGEPRLFTDADLAVLQMVKEFKARDREPLTTAQVVERLQAMPPADLQQPFIDQQPSPPAAPPSVVAGPGEAQLPAVHVDVSTLIDSRFTALLERQDTMSRDIASMRSERHGAIMLAAGVAIGVVVMLAALGIVLLIVR